MRTEKEIKEKIEAQRLIAHITPKYPDKRYCTESNTIYFWDGFIVALQWVIE